MRLRVATLLITVLLSSSALASEAPRPLAPAGLRIDLIRRESICQFQR